MNRSDEYLKRINAALSLREIPDHKAALEQLEKAKLLEPQDATVYLLLGLTHQDLDQLEISEEYLKKAHQIEPESNEITQAYGVLLSKNKKYEKAVDILQPFFESDTQNSMIAGVLASSLQTLDRLEEAIVVLRINYLQSYDEKIGLRLISLLEAVKNYDFIEKILIDEINKKPTPILLSRIGHYYLHLDEYNKSNEYFSKALSLRNDIEPAWFGLADIQISNGEYDKAIEIIESGLLVLPDSKRLHKLKGDVYFKKEDYDLGFQAYDSAIGLFEDNSKNKDDFGFLLYERDKNLYEIYGLKQALAKIDEDIITTKGFPILLSLKKRILIENKKYKEALAFIDSQENKLGDVSTSLSRYTILIGLQKYDSAFKILSSMYTMFNTDKDDLFEYIEDQGVDFFSRNEIEKSKQVFNDILKLDEARARSLNNLAFIHIFYNDFENALNLLEKAQKYGFTELEILLANKGYILLNSKILDPAISILNEALSHVQNPNDEAYLHIKYSIDSNFQKVYGSNFPSRSLPIKLVILANLATAYFLQGNEENAFTIANDIIEEYPEDSIGFRVLGNLYFNQNEYTKAKKYWNKALKKNRSKKEASQIRELLKMLDSQKKPDPEQK